MSRHLKTLLIGEPGSREGKTGMKARRALLLFCLCLLVNVALGKKPNNNNKPKPQTQKFEEEREVVAKKKTFTCKYSLIYKVAGSKFIVDKRKSSVTCSPDIKGKFGLVTETFTVGAKSVKVTHAIKKGKDTVTSLVVTDASEGPGNGSGGSSGGSGGSGGTQVSGNNLDCSCSLPFPDMSDLSSSSATPGIVAGRKLVEKLVTHTLHSGDKRKCIEVEGKPISCWLAGDENDSNRDLKHGSNGLGQLVPLAILFLLSALAAYGKVNLLQNLGILPAGRSALGQEEDQHRDQLEQLSRLFHAAERQFGGNLGGLGGLLGGSNGGAGNVVDGATNALVEQAIQQWINNGGVENLIMQFISGGGLETLVTQFFSGGGFQSLISAVMDNMDEQTINNLGQVAGENVQQQLANMDVEGMMASMTESLEGDLDQMMNALQEAVANNQIEEPQIEMSCKCRPRS